MKKYFLLIFLSLVIFVSWKTEPSKTNLSINIKSDRKYVLTIDQAKISKPRDTVVFWGKKKYSYVIAPVKLSNLADDTLVYINMTCGIYDIFTIDNKNISIVLRPCESNFPITYKLAPHKSATINTPLFFIKNKSGNMDKFRVGIYLCKYPGISKDEFWGFEIHNNWPKNLLIWSNQVTIPKS